MKSQMMRMRISAENLKRIYLKVQVSNLVKIIILEFHFISFYKRMYQLTKINNKSKINVYD